MVVYLRSVLHGERVPFLHGGAIYILASVLEIFRLDAKGQTISLPRLATYIESHPRYRLVLWYLRAFYQLQSKLLVIESYGEDGSRWCPM